jgi:hypothetical protein
MTHDTWYESERGIVVRRYFHVAGAAREIELAQREEWKVQEVKVNGYALSMTEKRGLFRRPLLTRAPDGTVCLRTPRSMLVWDHAHRMGKGIDVEVTYVRD